MSRLSQLIAEYNAKTTGPLMTQRRLAELVGLHEVTVSRHVTGTTSMDLQQAAAYACALGADVNHLIESAA